MKTKFFTGTGDKGKVVVGKQKLKKNAPLFEMLGLLDEVNAWTGYARATIAAARGRAKSKGANAKQSAKALPVTDILESLQELLFIAQADIAARGLGYPRKIVITSAHLKHLEAVIARVDALLPPIVSFVVPGGAPTAAMLDIIRTRSRSLERFSVGALGRRAETADMLAFLNRLSSVYFALARYENWRAGVKERKPSYKLAK